ncbi:hypothetical protein V5F32_08390 [Xanthobacter oligotrophicus]|uniref:Uncharacterized protein n=1 Tax=Xanthobacter oligotrophicus TaxID=2607286 RepID=A0ABW6ZTV7_9HYPH
MLDFSVHYLPSFQDIRERPALQKALDGVELNDADKMALALRAAEIHSATLCDGGPSLSAEWKAVAGGFMPKAALEGSYTCNGDDLAYMAIESAAETLQRYRSLEGLSRRGRLNFEDDTDARHEFLSLQVVLQYIAGTVLGMEGGWEDFAEPDTIVAEHIERFYSDTSKGGSAAAEALEKIGKNFRKGQEAAAEFGQINRPVVVSYKRKTENEGEGIFRAEVYDCTRVALAAIHNAFNSAEDERELSDVEVTFTEAGRLSLPAFAA